jgi:hypothetical protein
MRESLRQASPQKPAKEARKSMVKSIWLVINSPYFESDKIV